MVLKGEKFCTSEVKFNLDITSWLLPPLGAVIIAALLNYPTFTPTYGNVELTPAEHRGDVCGEAPKFLTRVSCTLHPTLFPEKFRE
jgi:hypothetical protein